MKVKYENSKACYFSLCTKYLHPNFHVISRLSDRTVPLTSDRPHFERPSLKFSLKVLNDVA